MIQELLLSGVVEERINKLSLPILNSSSSPSQSATSSPTTSSSETASAAAACAAASGGGGNQNNLRCPRCDSSNTKFCYYNNYNLTQPRHFCKTCRRYWTKGGALRNVPIGGGCRKTKSSAATSPSIVKSSGAAGIIKPNKPMTSLDIMGRAGPDVLLPSSPILWAGMPHSSHLLALLRASQIQNPNSNLNHHSPNHLNSFRVKEEGGGLVGGLSMGADSNTGLNLDNLGGFPMNNGGGPSLWRSTENQFQFMNHHQQTTTPQSLLLNEVPTSSGIQELYQRLKSSTSVTNNTGNSYGEITDHQFSMIGSNVGPATATASSTAAFMEPIPLTGGGEFGYWNPAMAWSDLSTANGAFP